MYEEYLYKEQLLNAFGKDNDLVDNVQLQLRKKIIDKLKHSTPAPPLGDNLLAKICNTLFADYLQAHHYHHSLAVFAPESHHSQNHFSAQELQSMLRLDISNGQALLESLVRTSMPKGRMGEKRTDSGMQTDDPSSIASLENKLSALDFSYKQKQFQNLKSVESSELRIEKFKTQLTKRLKKELEEEISRVRNFQIANIRMEEQQKNTLKMREFEEELEINYRSKLQKLRERQAEVIQRVTTKMKDIESYNYQARQRILRDMETVKARQEQMDRLRQQLHVKELELTGAK